MERLRKYNRANDRLEAQRQVTSDDLDCLGKTKIYSWANDIGKYIEVFKWFKKIEVKGNVNTNEKLKMKLVSVGKLRNMKVASLKANEVMKAGVSTLGAGALAGIASYGGAMMFASASTGTAIASLSGAAATNATLAWFGGGSLATGGLGMAGGTAVLGGIVAGPVLAVAGVIMDAKSEENLESAKKTYSEAKLAAEQMDTMTDCMKSVSEIAKEYNEFILEFSKIYQPYIKQVNDIYEHAKQQQSFYFINKVKSLFGMNYKIDYTKLSLEEQKILQTSWLMTQVLYSILKSPLLNRDGKLDKDALDTLNEAKDTTYAMIGG